MNPITHLNDEQMYALLDNAPDPAAKAHLAACVDCQNEMASLSPSLLNFRTAATNLAAAGTPSLIRRRVAVPEASRFAPRFWVGSLATAGLLLAVSMSVIHPATPGLPPNGTETAQTVNAPIPPTAIESDEALLDGIQQDLSTSIPPSLEPLAVSAGSNDNLTQN